MKSEAVVAILASEGLAQVAISCQHARISFVPQCTNFLFVLTFFSPFARTGDLRNAASNAKD